MYYYPDELLAMVEKVSNRGRWGSDDDLGTLNLITAETVRQATRLVTEGVSVSLSRPIDTTPSRRNPFPAHHLVSMEFARGHGDYLGVFLHGLMDTHLDALCHIPGQDGRAWADHELDRHRMPIGLHGTVEQMANGVTTRGVLYDVPRFRGVDYVADDEPVTGAELHEVARELGVEPRPGDAVIIRSGRDNYWAAHPDVDEYRSGHGVHYSAIEFLSDTDAALLVWDSAEAHKDFQGIPNPLWPDSEIAVHVHALALPYMGLPIIDNSALDELADRCQALGRYEFLFTAAPLHIVGATGSPINPLAIL